MRVNIWIRKENEEAWKAIENKSEYVNNLIGYVSDQPTNTLQGTIERVKEIVDAPLDLCKNGHLGDSEGKCLQVDCKYS